MSRHSARKCGRVACKLNSVDSHDYSPQQALDLLMRSLRRRNAELATQIQAVIDAGRDIVDESDSNKRSPKRSRTYRKTKPYSHEEALDVALNALRAYFIEQSLFVNSSLEEISAAALESAMNDRHGWRLYKERNMKFDVATQGQQKPTEIELRTETQISESAEETLSLHPVSQESIEEQRQNMQRLRKLVVFAPH